jgi:hypothetical protein
MRPKEKTENIGVRTTPAIRQAWEAAAKTDGYPLSVWIARRCNGQSATAPQLPTEPAPAKPKARKRGA